MTPFSAPPYPESAYFRLLEHQKKMRLPSYEPDVPLVLFIFFSRIAAGLSLVSLFFEHSIVWTAVALGCMVLATLASIAHLSVPLRFITMLRNNKSQLVWEIRLAGALTTFIGLQFLSLLPLAPWPGVFDGVRPFFPGLNALVALLFLISTGTAYRFDTHPAWKTFLWPLYYIVSGCLVGTILRATTGPSGFLPFLCWGLLMVEAALVYAYRGHLKRTSPTVLKRIVAEGEKRAFLAYLWTTFLLPAILTVGLFWGGNHNGVKWAMAVSCLLGIVLERILFFRVEKPTYFLSFIKNPEDGTDRPYSIRG